MGEQILPPPPTSARVKILCSSEFARQPHVFSELQTRCHKYEVISALGEDERKSDHRCAFGLVECPDAASAMLVNVLTW